MGSIGNPPFDIFFIDLNIDFSYKMDFPNPNRKCLQFTYTYNVHWMFVQL